MHRVRRPSVSGTLLAFLLGFGLLLPEMVHSLAHHHAAEHGSAHVSPHQGFPSGSAKSTDAHGGDHPHLDLIGTPSAKPTLAKAIEVQGALPAFRELETQNAQLLAVAPTIPPGGRDHGPPPPSRAPPLV